MKQLAIFFLVSAHSFLSRAPIIVPNIPDNITSLPKGYFRNPLDIPIKLAANFGELRPNHFHMGLDIRTNQRENLPVYAAAEGYISRVKIEESGFGHAIYITHPNGYTTLYAHLNDFYQPLQKYLEDRQYEQKQWEQEFELQAGQFPVTKGQVIAYSGNTGGSAGPHLHFEIRNTSTGNNINPWLFDLGLTDNIKPSVFRLYYFDRRYSTYAAGPNPIQLAGGNGNYTAANGVVTLRSPYISFAVAAGDKITAVSNYYGIYEAEIAVDDTVQSAFQLKDFSYDDTRYVNASIDYKTKVSGGTYIQHLSRLPGNYSLIYSQDKDGTVFLKDTLVHLGRVVVKDVAGNSSVVQFLFRWDPSITKVISSPGQITPMIPERANSFKAEDVEVQFSQRAFYDTVPFVYSTATQPVSKAVSAIHQLHNFTVPVHDSFTVRVRPEQNLPDSSRDRVVVQLVSNRKVEVVRGAWVNGWIEAKFRDLGVVKLLLDEVPPRITAVGFINGGVVSRKKSISFVVTDDLGEIKNFTALQDGAWLLFSRKNNSFVHNFDQRTPPGRHELVVRAEDVAGNITEKIFTYTR